MKINSIIIFGLFLLLLFTACKKENLSPTAKFEILNTNGIISLTNKSLNAENFLWEIENTKTRLHTQYSTENVQLELLCSTDYLIKLKVWQKDSSKANEVAKNFSYSCFSIIDTNAIKGKYKLKCNCLKEERYVDMVAIKPIRDTTLFSFDTIMEYRFPIESKEGYIIQEMPKKNFELQSYDIKKKTFNYRYIYNFKYASSQTIATFKTAVDSLLINFESNSSPSGGFEGSSAFCKYKGVKIK